MVTNNSADLQQLFPIVDPQTGQPTNYFVRYMFNHGQTLDGKIDPGRKINTGTGLTGGGDLTADRTLALANTAVTPGTYGDSTHVPQIIVDAQGRLTSAANVAVSGGGGGGGMTLISHVTTAASQSSVTFASIPGSYTHLQLVGHCGSEENNAGNTESLVVQFNGDTTGGNYTYTGQGLYGAVAGFPVAGGLLISSANTTGVPFGNIHCDILDYLDSSQMQLWNGRSTAWQSNVGILSGTGGGSWNANAAITDILIKPSGAQNWKNGSQFWLYGI